MEFPATPYSAATRSIPATFAAWGGLSQPALNSLYGKMTDRMLVLVEGSQLAAAAPDLPFTLIDGRKALPLHEVILFYGRLLWAADDALDTDLSVLVAPSKLAGVEAWAVADGRLDFSPCGATCFLQRVCELASSLTPPYPAALSLAHASLVPLEPHPVPPDMDSSWHVRVPLRILRSEPFGLLGLYADYVHLLGPLLRADARTDEYGRACVASNALADQATAGAMAAFAGDFDQLGGIVAEFLRAHLLPAALRVAELRWPTMLSGVNTLAAYADPAQRGAVVSHRFSTALNLMPHLQAAVAGEAPSLQYDMAVGVLSQLCPSLASATPSLASFYVLDRRIGTERFDLSATTALERIAAMSARSVRDASLERSASWAGGSGYSGAPSSKMTLDAVPRPRCFDRGSISLLTAWLNSPVVTNALVWSVAPAAPTANRAGVVGVPDDARSGVGALLEHYDAAGDHFEVLRAALAKRALPLIQAVLFDVGSVGDNAALGAISRARLVLDEYVSLKIVTLNDGSLEVDEDNTYRAPAAFVENLLCGKDWDSLEFHNACVRELDVTRCATTACASCSSDEQWFGPRSSDTIDAADRALAVLGWDRNDTFYTRAHAAVRFAKTTPGTEAELKAHAVSQIKEMLRNAAKRYRAFLASASPTASFPPFQLDTDRSVTMQAQARTARSFALSVGSVMPSLLVASAAPAAPAPAPAASPAGPPSPKRKGAKAPPSPAKTKRAARSASSIGDMADRVTTNTHNKVTFSWGAKPATNSAAAKPKSAVALDVAKIRLVAEKTATTRGICWPQQLMFAMNSRQPDDQARRQNAASYCPCKTTPGHESLTSVAHEPHAGITTELVNAHSTRS